jgi:dolichyl-phosphate-mannose-protein mannosyltransferase
MPVLVLIGFLLSANVWVGWLLGYRSITGFVIFWVLCALALITAWNLVTRVFPPLSRVDAGIRVGVVSFAIIVSSGLLLGSMGHLTIGACLALQAAMCAASFVARVRPSGFTTPARPALPVLPVAVCAALLSFGAGFAVTHAPLTLYDSVSYHLFFAARWLQDRTFSIIPTPFSDVAQAYAPGNGELFFVWLMLPFHGDLGARMGQLPFAVVAAATLYALARRLGAPARHAIYPPAFFLLSRPILEQAIGANVDLICAAMFLTSLYFGIVAVDRNDRRDWILWGTNVGLYWGSKYLALVYTPIFLLLAVSRGRRAGIAWALPGVAVFALPWYLRNWLVAGSPIYPASLAVAGVTLARGAFGRDAMLNTIFHTSDVRLFPVMAAHGMGPTLFLFWIPFALAGAASMIRRGWWPHGFMVLVPVLMVPLYWFGLPVNVDARFLMPAIAPAMLPLAFAFRNSRAWNACVEAAYAIGMVWIVAGAHAEVPANVPWFMSGWLALNGLVASQFVIGFVALTALMAFVWWLASRSTRWAIPLMVSLCAASATVLAAGGERWCRPSRCDYLDTTSPYIRANLVAGWRWIAANVSRSTIAYTGINLPYPLTGEQLTNRVLYVNINGRPRWRFHDYDRAYRAGRFEPIPPLLATSSGELMPVAQRSGPRDDALRPRYERMEGVRDGWIANLETFGVRHLFIAALSAYEIDYLWHTDHGFPIEEQWAAHDPQSFRLEYENPQVRIYAVDLR